MAQYASLVEEQTATTGTGALTLTGATTAHRTLAAAFSADDYVNYLIKNADGSEWERGYGKFNGTTGLTREFVRESSNSDALVTLSAGGHTVTIAAHPDMATWQGIVLKLGVNQSINDATNTTVNWQTEIEDTESIITVPATKIICPDWVDKVRVNLLMGWGTGAAGVRKVSVDDMSGGDYDPIHAEWREYTAGDRMTYSTPVFAPTVSGADYGFYVRVYQNDGAALLLQSFSALWVEFVQ